MPHRKREQKSDLRERLIQAGLDYMREHDARSLTMRKLADLCDVTPHAIYNHFPSKDELIRALNDRVLSSLTFFAVDALTCDSSDFVTKMSHLADTYLLLLERYPYHLQAAQRKNHDPHYKIIQTPEGFTCFGKYPGFPSLKKLSKICTLPPAILKGLLKLGKLSMRFKRAPSEIPLQPDATDAVMGQTLLLCLLAGLPGTVQTRPYDKQSQATTNSMLRSLLQRVL